MLQEKTARLLDTVPLETPGTLEVHKANDAIFAVVTQKGSQDSLGECSVYLVVEESLRRAQVLEVANVSAVKLTSYFGKVRYDKFYLVAEIGISLKP